MKNNFLSASGLSKVFEKVKNFVKPNPPLLGTEEALTGLEINGIKFKAGGETPHLYWHSIYINAMDLYKNKEASGLPVNYALYLIILSASGAPVTWEYLKQLMDTGANLMVVSGWVEEKTIDAFSMYYAGSPYYRYTVYTNSSTSGVSGGAYYWKNDASPSTFTDTVNQIF